MIRKNFTDDVPAMELQAENYKKLIELIPAFINGEICDAELTSQRAPIVLITLQRCNEDLCDSSASIIQTLQSGGHRPITDVQMLFMINEKDSLVRAVSLYREGWPDCKCVYTDDNEIDPDIEKELDEFMSDWLNSVIGQGFELTDPAQNRSMDEGIGGMSF